jgi:hypothetical protein
MEDRAMVNKFALFCAFAIAVLDANLASAQNVPFGNPKPLSSVGGNAAREMRSIYRTAIGTGYSVDSLNQLTMNRATARIPDVGQASARGSRIDTGLASFGGNLNKPFGNYSPAPTVSPYLNLFREDLDGQSDFNYQTLVRPQLRQQELNDRLQRENFEMARRLQAIGAQSDFNPAGSTSQPPTGHQTVFQYYGHYYPGLQQGRRR